MEYFPIIQHLLHTIIMSKNDKIRTSLMLLLIWAHLNADAQNNSLAANAEKQGLYSLNIFAGGGASYYLSEPGKAAGIKSEVSRLHAAGTLRIMWHPDHLLRIGLETGIADFYS